MKITKQRLKQLVKEEYSSLNEFNWDEVPGGGAGAEGGGCSEDPSMGFEHKLNRILEILEAAFPDI